MRINVKKQSVGDKSTGDKSTGNRSTGHYSTGSCSTGHFSTGDSSTGYSSTGNCSTGYYSTGNYSTGSCSTGCHSTGHCSTGYYSTGFRSTGSWSISNYSAGHFSTIDNTGFSVFNKPYNVKEWENAEKPKFIYFDLTEWINENEMSDEEKEDNPTYTITGGYLRVYSYREAWKNAWKNASKKDKKLLYNLPNFNPKVFKKISGVNVTKDKTYKKFIKKMLGKSGE